MCAGDAECMCECVVCVFFFFSSRRRHTRYYMDWSSDVCSSDLSPNGRWVAFGSGQEWKAGQWVPGSDYAVHLRDIQSGKDLRLFEGHTDAVASVALSSDGSCLLSGG